MRNAGETVVEHVGKEIASCMAFMPIIYLETEDRTLLGNLLGRKDCFTIYEKKEDGSCIPAEYTKENPLLNVVQVDRTTGWEKIKKRLEAWENKPLYFVSPEFHSMDFSTQRKTIRSYIKYVFEKNPSIPLRQNLLITSPVGMSIGDEEENSIPAGFGQFVRAIDVPLLGLCDIANLIVSVQNRSLCQIGSGQISADAYMAKPDDYIYEFKGMNRSQIEYVLHELKNHLGVVSNCGIPQPLQKKISSGELNRLARQLIKKQKQQNAEANGDIEYIDTTRLVVPGGMDGVEEWILAKKKILDYPQRARDYAVRFPKGILMAGLPGSGKSLTARYIARTFDLPLIQFKMDMVLQGIVGSSEQRLRQVLKLFEAQAPCVIWIDEIEKEFAGMKGSGENDGGVNKRCLAKLLNWMQENKENCFIYATANRTEELPQELLRRGRFDRLYYSFLPMAGQCVDILQNQIQCVQEEAPKLFDSSVNFEGIRKMGNRLFEKLSSYEHRFFTGSDIEGLVLDVKEQMFIDLSRDISNGESSYGILELEQYLLQVAEHTITYAEGNFEEVLDYWLRLRTHQFHNVAVRRQEEGDSDRKYQYMLFDFSDLQHDGSDWSWRKGLKCHSNHPYDKNMYVQLTQAIKKRISSAK